MSRHEKITFTGSQGHALAARLDLPSGPPRAFVLFAHCFSCSKDQFATASVSRALCYLGFGVLRFDFTGLGASEGDFANTNFSSNVEDILHAVDFMRSHHRPPAILIGHSLGGAAILDAASSVPEAKAVATIGAPGDPRHLEHLFAELAPVLAEHGEQEPARDHCQDHGEHRCGGRPEAGRLGTFLEADHSVSPALPELYSNMVGHLRSVVVCHFHIVRSA